MSASRIAVMLNTYVPGRMGGMGVFAEQLVQHLPAGADGFEFVDVYTQGQPSISSSRPSIHIDAANSGVGALPRLVNFLYNRLFAGRLRSQVGAVDLAYYPLTSVTLCVKPRRGTVVTVHDLQHRELPQYFSWPQKMYRSLTYERAAKRARAVVVTSDFTATTVERYLGVPRERMRTIYPGIDHAFFTPAPKPATNGARPSDENFLYYPARGLPHKNHQVLFEAVAQLRTQHPGLRLVLTGADAHLLGELPDFVTHEGHVSAERVRELFHTASAVVFPSLYEGFGFPPLEAMASGCPVVCSHVGSLPEVCGDAAELVDPHSASDVVRGIEAVLSAPTGYRERGLLNARRFTWEKTSEAYVELFRSLLDE